MHPACVHGSSGSHLSCTYLVAGTQAGGGGIRNRFLRVRSALCRVLAAHAAVIILSQPQQQRLLQLGPLALLLLFCKTVA